MIIMNKRITLLISVLLIIVLLTGMTGCGAKETKEQQPQEEAAVAVGEAPASAIVDTVCSEGMEMDYTVFGQGKNTFVILPGLSIHSVMGSADAIADAYQAFTEYYTVYVFDPPKNLHPSCTVRDMAEDTAVALKTLGIDKADIFGASQGGMMALYLAIDHPELVGKIILGSSLARPNETFSRTVETWKALASEKKETELLECFVDNVYSEATLEAYREILITSNRGITDEEYSRFLIQADACGSFDCYNELTNIHCPVLVLGSEGDKIVTAEGSREIAEVLGCEIYIYDENYGHGVYDEAPDYKQRCLDFLVGE